MNGERASHALIEWARHLAVATLLSIASFTAIVHELFDYRFYSAVEGVRFPVGFFVLGLMMFAIFPRLRVLARAVYDRPKSRLAALLVIGCALEGVYPEASANVAGIAFLMFAAHRALYGAWWRSFGESLRGLRDAAFSTAFFALGDLFDHVHAPICFGYDGAMYVCGPAPSMDHQFAVEVVASTLIVASLFLIGALLDATARWSERFRTLALLAQLAATAA